jgi:hypothetical protein
MKALVTGATGFVGRDLVLRLNDPIVVSRHPQRARAQLNVEAIGWNPLEGPPKAEAFDGVDTVFHLAGDPVAGGRWTSAKKERIRASRVVGTRHLGEGLAALPEPPTTLISHRLLRFPGGGLARRVSCARQFVPRKGLSGMGARRSFRRSVGCSCGQHPDWYCSRPRRRCAGIYASAIQNGSWGTAR